MGEVPVTVVTGPPGVGKTVTAWEMRNILRNRGVAHALIDMDNLCWCYVPDSVDRLNRHLGARNLTAVWANFAAVGAPRLIISGIVEGAADVDLLGDCVPGAQITVFRLVLDKVALEQRMRDREHGPGVERRVARSLELAEIMETNGIGDFCIDANRDAVAVAEKIIALSGWLT